MFKLDVRIFDPNYRFSALSTLFLTRYIKNHHTEFEIDKNLENSNMEIGQLFYLRYVCKNIKNDMWRHTEFLVKI